MPWRPLSLVVLVVLASIDAAHALDVTAFGARGDGQADDTAAIQSAIAAAARGDGTVHLPNGTYKISSTLVMSRNGLQLVGAGRDVTVIATSTGIDAIRVSGEMGVVRDLSLQGNRQGRHGLVLHNANQGTFERLKITNFTGDGVRWDTAAATPTGNNNTVRLFTVWSAGNKGSGFAVPSFQVDNNAANLIGCVATNNGAHGLQYKGQSLLVIGGLFASNHLYGVQFSEPSDRGFTVGAILLGPHIEGNGSGGVRGAGKSVRNLLLRAADMQGLTNATGSEDFELVVDNSSGGILTNSGTTLTNAVRIGATMRGTTAIGGHLSAATTWDPPRLAMNAQTTTPVTVAGANPGDPVVVGFSHDLQGLQLTGYVSSANTVTVVLRNGTGAPVDLPSGTLRADVWQH